MSHTYLATFGVKKKYYLRCFKSGGCLYWSLINRNFILNLKTDVFRLKFYWKRQVLSCPAKWRVKEFPHYATAFSITWQQNTDQIHEDFELWQHFKSMVVAIFSIMKPVIREMCKVSVACSCTQNQSSTYKTDFDKVRTSSVFGSLLYRTYYLMIILKRKLYLSK